MDHTYRPGKMIAEYVRTRSRCSRYFLRHVLPSVGELSKTFRLRNSATEKSCFVFGNGPSLSTLDPDRIAHHQKRGMDVFCVNNYIFGNFSKTVKPDYYLATDPGYYGLRGPGVDMPEETYQRIPELISTLNTGGVGCFVPIHFRRTNLLKKSWYFNDSENLFSRNISPLRPRGYLSLSTMKALSMASWLGYKKIYICGMDHDYHLHLTVDPENQLSYVNRHFYNQKGKVTPLNEYTGGISDHFWQSHLTFKNYYLFDRSKIINLAVKGFVDAFSRKTDIDVHLPATE